MKLVKLLLDDLETWCQGECFEVLLTLNIPEEENWNYQRWLFPIKIIRNFQPKGFGANHNHAFFSRTNTGLDDVFVVMNPDLRLVDNPFPRLLEEIRIYSGSVIAPTILSPQGIQEDSIRYFPTLRSLILKVLNLNDGRYQYHYDSPTFPVQWVAGMFMLFQAKEFEAVGGFDKKFYMYYEDVDICIRLWKAHRVVLGCPQVQVIHDARRKSRNNFPHMKWHLQSMARYFWKHWYRLPRNISL